MAKKDINYDVEIHQVDERISKLRTRRQQLIQLKTEKENAEILSLIKENKVSVDDLKSMISTLAVEKQ